MRRITPRLAIAVGCAVATAAFTGGALAGNGQGNENAPGQQKKDDAAQVESQQQAPPAAGARTRAGAGLDAVAGLERRCSGPGEEGGRCGVVRHADAVPFPVARPGEEGRRDRVVRHAGRREAEQHNDEVDPLPHGRSRHRHRDVHRAGGHAGDESRRLQAIRERQDRCADRGRSRRAERHAHHRPGQQSAAQGDGLWQAEQQERRRRRSCRQEL